MGFSLVFVIVYAILIDRLCQRNHVSSTRHQFASFILASLGDVTVLILFKELLPRGQNGPLGIANEMYAILGILVAGCCGGAASFAYYTFLRFSLRADPDYDEKLDVADELHIANVPQPRDGDDVRSE